MLELIIALGAVLVLGVAIIGLLFLLGMRAKSPLVLGPVIWLSKRFINPRQMRSAGTPGAYAAIIRHRGRVSGRDYETPIGAVPVDDGFLVALPYGSRASWLRNVLANGAATIVHEGHTYEVNRPELVATASVMDRFPAGDQRGFRLLRVDECLRVRRVEPDEAAARSATPAAGRVTAGDRPAAGARSTGALPAA
jgi:deazaflavin-dependent oxidoreductase (nitroreductase family)